MVAITRFKSGSVIFNVDHSVGKFGRNQKTDVQLVQFLLNKLIQHIKDKKFQRTVPVPDLLVVDGICGTKTIAAILWFQKSENISPGLTVKLSAEDATINHADAEIYHAPNIEFYTMWALQGSLEAGNVLPKKAEEIPIQPLRSELQKYFDQGLTPHIKG